MLTEGRDGCVQGLSKPALPTPLFWLRRDRPENGFLGVYGITAFAWIEYALCRPALFIAFRA